ncbi:MAG: hypothetical protein ABIQ27_03225 [Flavobacterium sp.]|uniref:hypothetical protein n=1 Tax=Flavobacterium sp. TaxID=239 RepID=UPI003265C7B9
MKKIIFLFALAATLFSCTDNDDTIVNDSDLQKVVFYGGTSNERQWNINNDLLTNITLADGTIVEEFTYDSQNRVILDVKYTSGVISETNTITYNSDNKISSINGLPYTFNAATRTYAYSYGSSFTISCVVNEDMLAVDFIRTGTGAGEYHMMYASGNMTSFEKMTSGSTDIVKNFHFDGTYVANTNPLYNAVLAAARVKSLTDPNFFVDSVASTGIAGGFDRGAADPNYYHYGIAMSTSNTPTHNIKDFSIGTEVLDGSMNLVDFYAFAEYYYQF